jgi:hypothetical protein
MWAINLSKQIEMLWRSMKKMKIVAGKGNIRSTDKMHNVSECTERNEMNEFYQQLLKMSNEEKMKEHIFVKECYYIRKYDARKIGAKPYNKNEVYEFCRRTYLTRPRKKTKKNVFDVVAGKIISMKIRSNYWQDRYDE